MNGTDERTGGRVGAKAGISGMYLFGFTNFNTVVERFLVPTSLPVLGISCLLSFSIAVDMKRCLTVL